MVIFLMHYYQFYSLDTMGAHIIDVCDSQADGDATAVLIVGTPVSGVSQEVWNLGRKVTDFAAVSVLLSGWIDADPELDCSEEIGGRRNNISAAIPLDRPPSSRTLELRSTPRNDMRLPILILIGGRHYAAIIRNLSCTGAMIRTSAPLNIPLRIEMQFGSIQVAGAVVWQLQGNFGITFDQSICEQQLGEELLARTLLATGCNG